jgi:hypothetical protein
MDGSYTKDSIPGRCLDIGRHRMDLDREHTNSICLRDPSTNNRALLQIENDSSHHLHTFVSPFLMVAVEVRHLRAGMVFLTVGPGLMVVLWCADESKSSTNIAIVTSGTMTKGKMSPVL